ARGRMAPWHERGRLDPACAAEPLAPESGAVLQPARGPVAGHCLADRGTGAQRPGPGQLRPGQRAGRRATAVAAGRGGRATVAAVGLRRTAPAGLARVTGTGGPGPAGRPRAPP